MSAADDNFGEEIRALFALYAIGGEESIVEAVSEMGSDCPFADVGGWISRIEPGVFRARVVNAVQASILRAMSPLVYPGMSDRDIARARAVGQEAAEEAICQMGAVGAWFKVTNLRVEMSRELPDKLRIAVAKGLAAWRRKQAGVPEV